MYGKHLDGLVPYGRSEGFVQYDPSDSLTSRPTVRSLR